MPITELRLFVYVVASISPSWNMPAADFADSDINEDIVASSFCAFLLRLTQEIISPVAKFLADCFSPFLSSLFKLIIKGAISFLSLSNESVERFSDLTSRTTSVLPASSRRASIIVCTCSVAKPCALRFKAREVNASCASFAVDVDNVWIV